MYKINKRLRKAKKTAKKAIKWAKRGILRKDLFSLPSALPEDIVLKTLSSSKGKLRPARREFAGNKWIFKSDNVAIIVVRAFTGGKIDFVISHVSLLPTEIQYNS